jgi:hypothetical protein
LERELEALQQKLSLNEDKSNKMYLHMYKKEQEVVGNPGPSTSASTPSKFSMPELLHQLQVTQDELENIKVSFVRTCWKLSVVPRYQLFQDFSQINPRWQSRNFHKINPR